MNDREIGEYKRQHARNDKKNRRLSYRFRCWQGEIDTTFLLALRISWRDNNEIHSPSSSTLILNMSNDQPS